MHNLELTEQESDEVQLLVADTMDVIISKPIARFAYVIRNMFAPQLHKNIKDIVGSTSIPPITLTEV